MTPCEEKGYKVDQVFKDMRDSELFVLVEDDGSDNPYFTSLERNCEHHPRPLRYVNRIYPPEELSQNVEVTCEGKTVTISRKDAQTLNLCD